MNKWLFISSEVIQFLLLITNYVLNIVKNFQPYAKAKYYLLARNDSYYAINLNSDVMPVNYRTECTNMSESTFEKLDKFFTDYGIINWVKIQYFFFFVLITVIQIYTTCTRKSKNKENHTKLACLITKITFAPAVMIVTGIDYTRPCIKLKFSAGIIDVATFANCLFALAFVLTFNLDCKKQQGKDVKYFIIITMLIVYFILAFIIYFVLFFGPVLAIIENILLGLNIILDVVSEIFASR
jgi:hypothetical protein